MQGERPRQAAVAADDHQTLNTLFIEAAQTALLPLCSLEFLVARGLQNRAAALQNTTDFHARQQFKIAVNQTCIRLAHAVDFDVVIHGGPHDRANRCIHPRRITAAGHHRYSFHRGLLPCVLCRNIVSTTLTNARNSARFLTNANVSSRLAHLPTDAFNRAEALFQPVADEGGVLREVEQMRFLTVFHDDHPKLINARKAHNLINHAP